MVASENIWIPVESDDDPVRLHAWLFRPDGASGPRPAITMAHGFAGLKDRGLRGFAERLSTEPAPRHCRGPARDGAEVC
jgi:uncharacterized protein